MEGIGGIGISRSAPVGLALGLRLYCSGAVVHCSTSTCSLLGLQLGESGVACFLPWALASRPGV